eukprot:TRINITY_DN20661_c0_g1_i1.p1 TRINITY_DN20661_c0_g1~~TRINITY_DN20661_c0_g1_i1.p1  ORF type:complete len:315 (+),score=108.39 TRINITY_DN20661_c0_g1_i1:34-945(+)
MATPNKPYRPIVIAGPSGAGKSTMIKKLQKTFPGVFGLCVSHTTRGVRPGEENHVHYHFIDREEHARMVAAEEFLEFAEYSGNLYGTSKQAIKDVQSSGMVCLLDIDMQGVKSVKAYAEQEEDLNPGFVFIQPTDLDELEERLIKRGEAEASRALRLETARIEMAQAQEPHLFDRIIVNGNDKFDEAYKEMLEFVRWVNPRMPEPESVGDAGADAGEKAATGGGANTSVGGDAKTSVDAIVAGEGQATADETKAGTDETKAEDVAEGEEDVSGLLWRWLPVVGLVVLVGGGAFAFLSAKSDDK